jgi:hypothetical protein
MVYISMSEIARMKIEKIGHFARIAKRDTPTRRGDSLPVVDTVAEPERTSRIKRGANGPLAELLKLVNLVPEDAMLPKHLMTLDDTGPEKEVELFAAINSLPNELAAHLREVFEWEDWDHGVRRKDDLDDLHLRLDNISRVLERFDHIRNAREGFRRLLGHRVAMETVRAHYKTLGCPIHTSVVGPGGSIVTIDTENKIDIRLDPFSEAIQGVDIYRIRRCAVCAKLFLARRIDSAVCDPNSKCAKTYSKRKERGNAKLRAELAAKKAGKKKEEEKER